MKLTKISTSIITMRKEKPRPIVQCCQLGRNFPMWLQFFSEQNKTTFLIVNSPPPLQWMTPFCAGLERILFLEKPMKLVKNI